MQLECASPGTLHAISKFTGPVRRIVRCMRSAMAALVVLLVAMGQAVTGAGPAAADTATCGGIAATLVGTPGSDTLYGSAGNDVIAGLGGDDHIFGLDGDDEICGGDGDDVMSGGPGTDAVDYGYSARGVQVDLQQQLATGEGSDQITEVEDVYGSRFDDRLTGDGQPNTLIGQNGDDVLAGGPGNDVLIDQSSEPSATNDFIGGLGDDSYYGGIANDVADFNDPTIPPSSTG